MDPDPPSLIYLSVVGIEIILPFIPLLLLLLMSALVSGSEVAFFYLTPADISELQNSKSQSDQGILKLLERPKRLLGTILVSNNFINIAIVILAAIIIDPITSNWLNNSYSLEFAGISTELSGVFVVAVFQISVVTFLILLFGEILPKVYATRNRLTLARLMAKPMLSLQKVFGPLNKLLILSSHWLDKPSKKENISVDDLEHVLDLTEEQDNNSEEQRILRGIVKFGSTTARQIMTPRTDVVAFNITDNYEEVIKVVTDSGFSRIPVYEDNFDNIKGVIYIKDLLPHVEAKPNFEWTELLRDPFFVPESKKIDDLLREFQEKKIHMAVVVDEFGGTSGIISLEDVIEEIVGEISDEFDDDDLVYSKLDDNTYVFEGKTPLNDFCKVLKISESLFQDAQGDTDSLAGLMLEISGKFPQKGEKVEFGGFIFEAESVKNRRINRIKVTTSEE